MCRENPSVSVEKWGNLENGGQVGDKEGKGIAESSRYSGGNEEFASGNCRVWDKNSMEHLEILM